MGSVLNAPPPCDRTRAASHLQEEDDVDVTYGMLTQMNRVVGGHDWCINTGTSMTRGRHCVAPTLPTPGSMTQPNVCVLGGQGDGFRQGAFFSTRILQASFHRQSTTSINTCID